MFVRKHTKRWRVAFRLKPLVVACILAGTSPALANDASAEARDAYDRGAQAYDRGDYADAVVWFAKADELAPHPVALEHALKSAIRAKDAVWVMRLIDRAGRAPLAGAIGEIVPKARNEFAPLVARVVPHCPPRTSSCKANINGMGVPAGEGHWLLAGRCEVVFEVDGHLDTQTLQVAGGETYEVRPKPPTPAQPELPPKTAAKPFTADTQPHSGGISPTWFWVGVGATALLGGATAFSGVDALQKHDEFQSNQTDETEQTGRSAQTRTNVLVAFTAAAGVTTAAIGLFAVRWSSGAEDHAQTNWSLSGTIGPSTGTGLVLRGQM